MENVENSITQQPEDCTAIPEEQATAAEQKQEKTFTQDELNAIVQRRISEEKEKARKEADRKAAMTLVEREQALSIREAELNRRDAESAAEKLLLQKGLPPQLSHLLDFSSEDSLQNSIQTMEATFLAAVQKGVEARFKCNGYIPRGSAAGSNYADDDDDFVRGLTK